MLYWKIWWLRTAVRGAGRPLKISGKWKKSQGKVRKKLGNLEVENKWQPCIADVAGNNNDNS